MYVYKSKNFYCPIEYSLAVIGGKWKVKIIWFLKEGTKRFGELERLMPDTSRKVLIQHLKELENDRIIMRTVYPQVPPKVEYSLTEQGKSLMEIFTSLRAWGEQHQQCMQRTHEGAEACYIYREQKKGS